MTSLRCHTLRELGASHEQQRGRVLRRFVRVLGPAWTLQCSLVVMTSSLSFMDLVARRAAVLGLLVAAWLGCFGGSSASADEGSLSTELRFGVFSPSYRWSGSLPDSTPVVNYAERSLYFVPSLGARFYPRGGHGALAELAYRVDADTDSVCLLFCPPDPPSFRIGFLVAHVGYAYRHVVASRRRPQRNAWAFTPHLSFAAGAAFSELVIAGVPSRSPVVGGRAGFDIDWHSKRFFAGWSFSYEILVHTNGSIRRSQFFDWNFFPLFRVGVVIGRTAAEQRQLRR